MMQDHRNIFHFLFLAFIAYQIILKEDQNQYQTSTTRFSTYTKIMLNKWLKNKTYMNYADESKEK